MRARFFEWAVMIVAVSLIGWATQLYRGETDSGALSGNNGIVERDEYEILAAGLDFLWASEYGLGGFPGDKNTERGALPWKKLGVSIL